MFTVQEELQGIPVLSYRRFPSKYRMASGMKCMGSQGKG